MCLLCSVEIAPCLDPGYYVQKSVKSKLKAAEEPDSGLSRYMKKGLYLPVNTFAGIITWHAEKWSSSKRSFCRRRSGCHSDGMMRVEPQTSLNISWRAGNSILLYTCSGGPAHCKDVDQDAWPWKTTRKIFSKIFPPLVAWCHHLKKHYTHTRKWSLRTWKHISN